MANPSGNHQDANHASSGFVGGNVNNENLASAPESSGTGMMHNPGISMDWTPNEQAILENGLNTYASESSVIRYAKIALQLPNKTVRDVALRYRWMTKKETNKRRKEEHNLTRKTKERKGRVIDPSAKSSHFAVWPNVPPYALPKIPMNMDDVISCKVIAGPTGQLLEQNAQVLNQISANMSTMQLQDNLNLFCQSWDNILKLMNGLTDMPDIMKQMPPLPAKVNEELANAILPGRNPPMQ